MGSGAGSARGGGRCDRLPPVPRTWSAPRTCRAGTLRRCTASTWTRPRSRSTGRSTGRCPGPPRRRTRPAPCTSPTIDEQITLALAQVRHGTIPADPFMLVGQMTTADPTRSPAGTESLWAYTHVPQQTVVDAGDEGIRGVWDDADCERFADRMRPVRATRARASRSRIRPVACWARASSRRWTPTSSAAPSTAVPRSCTSSWCSGRCQAWGGPRRRSAGCTSASASAHPGGGVHGAPGNNAARAALAHRRLRFGRR